MRENRLRQMESIKQMLVPFPTSRTFHWRTFVVLFRKKSQEREITYNDGRSEKGARS